MKSFALSLAIGAVLIGPHTAFSATSYGTHTLETYQGMVEFCRQAVADARDLREPLTGKLADLCN